MEIDLEATKNEWLNTAGPFHIRRLGEHYGVFNDLFGKYAYFTPRVQLDIKVSPQQNLQSQKTSVYSLSSSTMMRRAQFIMAIESNPPMRKLRPK